jgi:hypothetical protein
MTARALLAALHSSVPSLVVFRLAALRPLLDADALRRMLRVPDAVDLAGATHVALTPFGPLVVHADDRVAHPRFGAVPAVTERESLYGAYAPWLAALPPSDPECLGVGRLHGEVPVALHVRVDGCLAEGVATFAREPSQRDYDLLRAVGVEYLGGERRGPVFLARFRNRLDQHLLAGRLAAFARTSHCNQFFLGGGTVDASLARGLREAADARIAEGVVRVRSAVAAIAMLALAQHSALLAVPPPPAPPEPYGDLVPLGLALAALRTGPETGSEGDAVARHLVSQRRDGLWPFHTGGLPTATDTSLVLQGFDEADLAPLEAFGCHDGGYVPQLWASRRDRARMEATPATRHWRQSDFPTTALVAGLRRRAGLAADAAVRWLAPRFERRSGLFFSNPYLTDWALAQALGDHSEQDIALRRRLHAEIAASVRPDHAFGRYDVPLSTALAILALAALGERGRIVRLAQLRLLDFVEHDGCLPAAVPFFSSVACEAGSRPDGRQVVRVGAGVHAITLYVDQPRIVTTALAALALAVPAHDRQADPGDELPHPRYTCPDAASYIARFALAPYVDDDAAVFGPARVSSDAFAG